MKDLIKTLSHKKTGFGHFEISIVIDGINFDTTTNDTMAIDAAFDECYDDQDNKVAFTKADWKHKKCW